MLLFWSLRGSKEASGIKSGLNHKTDRKMKQNKLKVHTFVHTDTLTHTVWFPAIPPLPHRSLGKSAPIIGYAHIVITVILFSLARMSGLKQNPCCGKSPMPGLQWSSCHGKLHYWLSRGWSAAVRVVGNTALVCVTACTGLGKGLHTLPSNPASG